MRERRGSRMRLKALGTVILGALLLSAGEPGPTATGSRADTGAAGGAEHVAAIAAVLDSLHDAAAKADEERYFAQFARDAVFFGTDPDERWTVEQFRAYTHPHFSRGSGWTYTVGAGGRQIHLADGRFAWFDEALDNVKYGRCRGTGALRRETDGWKIVQYNLSIPIPNDLAGEVVEMIRQAGTTPDR